MKKILIISDTHGNGQGIEKIRPLIEENDYIVHLGDGVGEARALFSEYPEKTFACAGNCDFFSPFPDEGILEVEKLKIFYCHGHKYGVKSTMSRLVAEAKNRDCDVALYGHTHCASVTELDGVKLINPGALRYPVGSGGSYCYLVVSGDKATAVIVGESVY